jgi:Thioredoxin-like
MKRLSILLLALGFQSTIFAADAPRTVDDGLPAAAKKGVPLFLDFQAQWCYSCYFMATNVLVGSRWQAVEKRTFVLEVDADSPDGAQWMKKLSVKALPSYVVLKSDGSELGRVVAEQSADKFYPAMDRILAGSDVLDTLKAKAEKGSIPAIADALAGFHARDQIQPGMDWYAALPAEERATAEKNSAVVFWNDRLQLEKAAKANDTQACVATAQRVLAGPIGCDRYYVVESLIDCSEKLPTDQRKALLEQQRPALDRLLAKQVFVDPPQCADQRTAVLVSAELEKVVGDSAAETAVLDRGIAATKQRLGSDLRKDRNAADNLRVYLARAGRTTDLDALMPKLMAAYPDDYVYSYRYGRSLLDRNRPAEALPYLEEAAQKTFGANRLTVAGLRVKALLALNRRADAEKVVADALEANGPWFPDQAAQLKQSLKG